MKILVDADACPVKEIIVQIAKQFQIPVFFFVDTSHILKEDYASVITVDKAADSVDFAILNQTEKKDICITQDYGLASMLLMKKAYVVHQNGFLYQESNIDRMLFERHISKEMRRHGKKGGHIKPRSTENDLQFQQCFQSLCQRLSSQSERNKR